MKKCPYCGSDLSDGVNFCVYCMSSLDEKKRVEQKRKTALSRTVVAAAIVTTVAALCIVFFAVMFFNPSGSAHGAVTAADETVTEAKRTEAAGTAGSDPVTDAESAAQTSAAVQTAEPLQTDGPSAAAEPPQTLAGTESFAQTEPVLTEPVQTEPVQTEPETAAHEHTSECYKWVVDVPYAPAVYKDEKVIDVPYSPAEYGDIPYETMDSMYTIYFKGAPPSFMEKYGVMNIKEGLRGGGVGADGMCYIGFEMKKYVLLWQTDVGAEIDWDKVDSSDVGSCDAGSFTDDGIVYRFGIQKWSHRVVTEYEYGIIKPEQPEESHIEKVLVTPEQEEQGHYEKICGYEP